MLSPQVFPEHEISLPVARDLLEGNIKSVQLSKVNSKNLKHWAMTSKEVMLGVFYSGTYKHCVHIDGSKGDLGTINDPDTSFGVKDRSDRQGFGISKLESLYVLKRQELDDGNRKGMQKRLRLPFVKKEPDDYSNARKVCPASCRPQLEKWLFEKLPTREAANSKVVEMLASLKQDESE